MEKNIERDYYSSEELMRETPRINGKEYGVVKGWHSNGNIRYEITYKKGLQCGARILFGY